MRPGRSHLSPAPTLLALQGNAGNRAVTAVMRSAEQRVVARCAAGCTCGGTCRDDEALDHDPDRLMLRVAAPTLLLQRRVVCPPGVTEEDGTGCYETGDPEPNQSVDPSEPNQSVAPSGPQRNVDDQPLVKEEDIWWSDVKDLWAGIFKRKWSCTASCNVEGTEPHCTGRVTGSASGSSEDEACREAKRDATQKAPRGCYARHCQCDCSKG
jgi:hypothetical protein